MQDDHVKPTRITNPDTGMPESKFRERVREALNLGWDARDETIIQRISQLMAEKDFVR